MKADKIQQNMVLVVKYCEHEKIQNPKSMDFGHHKDALLVSLRPVHPSRPATIFPSSFLLSAKKYFFLLQRFFSLNPLPFFFSTAKNIFPLSKYFPTTPKKIPSPSFFFLLFLRFFLLLYKKYFFLF